MIGKRMLTGNLLDDPDELTRSVDKRASPPAMPSDEMIGKRMLTGNLLEDPEN